jgi:uncharacterized pyridoxamine 5'-phosphate oxidase family protein
MATERSKAMANTPQQQKTVIDFLVQSQVQYLATIGLDDRPKVRPFQFKLEEGGKLYFSTTNDKQVYKEITQQPYVELCACGENGSWLRLSGKVVFSQDRSIKSRIIEEAIPRIKAVYQTPDNPLWALFYLDEATATIADFSGNPPQTFRL